MHQEFTDPEFEDHKGLVGQEISALSDEISALKHAEIPPDATVEQQEAIHAFLVAHTYTITKYDSAPTIALSLVAGGSLAADTTYYYRAQTGDNWVGMATCYRLSAMSPVQSITTTSTNRSIKIDITHPTGNPEYTWLWAHVGSDPGVGNWNDEDNYPNIRALHDGSLYMYPINRPNKITTWTDDGTHEAWTNNVYRLGANPNYGYAPVYEEGRHSLDCKGGTTEDPLSFDSIYAEAVSQSWTPSATIERIDIDGAGQYAVGYLTGYRMHFLHVRIDHVERTGVFNDRNKLIVLEGRLYFYCETTWGHYEWSYDSTTDGIHFYLTGWATCFGRIEFTDTDYPKRLYDTRVTAGGAASARSTNYGSGFIVSGTDWEIIDMRATGFQWQSGLNDAVMFAKGDESCLVKRFYSARHRYSGQLISPTPFQVEDCTFCNYGGTGLIVYQLTTDDVERVFTGVTLTGWPGLGDCLYVRRLGPTWNYWTKLSLINSWVYDFTRVRWYSGASELPTIPGSYVKLKYTVNVRVTDQDGAPIEDASVVCANADGDQEWSVQTAADGTIAEQLVLSKMQTPEPDNATSSYVGGVVTDYNPFTISISKDEYETMIVEADIYEATDWEFSLLPAGAVQAQGINAVIEGDIRAEV
ncbi:MAG: carboxypeptidase-like regulatory domain-containing protein [Planctomycetota bacterium]